MSRGVSRSPSPVIRGNRRRPVSLRIVEGAVTGLARVRGKQVFDPDIVEMDARDHVGDVADDVASETSDLSREPLEVLCESYEREAELTDLGRVLARSQLVTHLSNQLRLRSWLRSNPDAAAAPVDARLVITGLPRTGTTILQQLLALDERFRTLRAWEAGAPVTPPRSPVDRQDPRFLTSRRVFRLVGLLAPAAASVHHVEPELPTECIALQAVGLQGMEFAGTSFVPSHLRWTLAVDSTHFHDLWLDALRVLQHGYETEGWFLKSPAHLADLDAVAKRFPGARFVWTHRDPLAAITSHASLTTVLCRIGSADIGPEAIGRLWADTWPDVVDRALDARAEIGDERFLDLEHGELVQDPLRAVERIYEWSHIDLPSALRHRMTDHLRANPRDGRGRHRYAPEEYGIDPVITSARMERYSDWRASRRG